MKTNTEEDWDTSTSPFIDYTGCSAESISTAGSPLSPTNTCTPTLSQSFEELNFRAACSKSLDPSAAMLSSSSGWGSSSQYSTDTSSYPSSTSSAQSYYSTDRPAMVAPGRSQQNLPSLTEMNLNSTPSYTSRPAHGRIHPHHHTLLGSSLSTPYFSHNTDALDISYTASKPTLASPYTTPYNSFSPRSGYNHGTQYSSNLESYTPAIDTYAYSNGHSWPPSLPYPSNYPNMSDTASISSGRRRRGNLPKHVTDILRAWFHDHLDHPYPTDEDKQMLIGRTNLTISQVGTALAQNKSSYDN